MHNSRIKYKLKCESANYIGYINCKPKDEFMNPEGFEMIDKAL